MADMLLMFGTAYAVCLVLVVLICLLWLWHRTRQPWLRRWLARHFPKQHPADGWWQRLVDFWRHHAAR